MLLSAFTGIFRVASVISFTVPSLRTERGRSVTQQRRPLLRRMTHRQRLHPHPSTAATKRHDVTMTSRRFYAMQVSATARLRVSVVSL